MRPSWNKVFFAYSVPLPVEDVLDRGRRLGGKQFADGTITWTSPSGSTYTTKPGGSLFFPVLATPTGELAIDRLTTEQGEGRGVMMPRRRRTRKQQREERIAAERAINEQLLKRQQWLFAELENADKPAPPTIRHPSEKDYLLR